MMTTFDELEAEADALDDYDAQRRRARARRRPRSSSTRRARPARRRARCSPTRNLTWAAERFREAFGTDARRRGALLPAAVPRRRAAELGDQRPRHRLRRELRRGRRVVRAGPARRAADVLPRRPARVGEDAGDRRDPHGRRVAAQARGLQGGDAPRPPPGPEAHAGSARPGRPRHRRGLPPDRLPLAAREARPRPRRARDLRRGADRPAGARVLLGARRAGPRGLRPDREHRRVHVHAGRRRADRHRRQAARRRRAADRRRRRDPHALARRVRRATSRTRRRRPRRSTPTAGCTPATSA